MRTVHKKNVILYAVVFFIIGILSMNLILLFNSSICRWFWFHQEEKQALQEIRLHPSDIDSYRKYFFILIKKGKVDKDKALEYARKIVELSPNDADVLRDAARQIAFYSPNNKEEINKLMYHYYSSTCNLRLCIGNNYTTHLHLKKVESS